LKTFLEFQHQIELHRKRVVKLGLALANSQYPALNQRFLHEFLSLHDYSKTIVSLAHLPKFQYSHRKLPAQRLFEFYGKTPQSETETENLMDTINAINFIDKKVCEDYFIMTPQLSWGTQEDFYTIERVADLVDRSLDPMAAEEFGHPMLLASEYIQDPYMMVLSLWLESHYHQITKELSFSSVS
jgi:hypothetical protein